MSRNPWESVSTWDKIDVLNNFKRTSNGNSYRNFKNEVKRVYQRSDAERIWEFIDVPGDGHCLFHSIARAVYYAETGKILENKTVTLYNRWTQTRRQVPGYRVTDVLNGRAPVDMREPPSDFRLRDDLQPRHLRALTADHFKGEILRRLNIDTSSIVSRTE